MSHSDDSECDNDIIVSTECGWHKMREPKLDSWIGPVGDFGRNIGTSNASEHTSTKNVIQAMVNECTQILDAFDELSEFIEDQKKSPDFAKYSDPNKGVSDLMDAIFDIDQSLHHQPAQNKMPLYHTGMKSRTDNGVIEQKMWEDYTKHRSDIEIGINANYNNMTGFIQNLEPVDGWDHEVYHQHQFSLDDTDGDILSNVKWGWTDGDKKREYTNTQQDFEQEAIKRLVRKTCIEKNVQNVDGKFGNIKYSVEKGHTNQVITILDCSSTQVHIVDWIYIDTRVPDGVYEELKRIEYHLMMADVERKMKATYLDTFSESLKTSPSMFEHPGRRAFEIQLFDKLDNFGIILMLVDGLKPNVKPIFKPEWIISDDDLDNFSASFSTSSSRSHNHCRNRYDMGLRPHALEWNGKKIASKYHNSQYPSQQQIPKKKDNRQRNFVITQPNASTRNNYNNRNKVTFNNQNMYKPKRTKK